MPKLQLYRGRFSVSIPAEVVKKHKWKKGDTLHVGEIRLNNGKVSNPIVTIEKVKKR